MSKFENTILPWWDNLSLGKKQALTRKYFPGFSVSMMDGEEITEVFEKRKKRKNTLNKISRKMFGEDYDKLGIFGQLIIDHKFKEDGE